jgi:CxxC motif-containing protein (DUF1111 family)
VGLVTGITVAASAAIFAATRDRGPTPPAELLVTASGGALTIDGETKDAFGRSAPTLDREGRRRFEIGDSFFTQNWVTAPASTTDRDGLGPLLNAQSCASCHVRDGRAQPPKDANDPERGLLLRLSVPDGSGGEKAHPIYGDQLQDRSILGVPAEGQIQITTNPVRGTFGDGDPFELLRPRYRIADPAYGPVGRDVLISPRIAQQVVGMGLLEAIPETDVVSAADPGDRDGDGISGRANRVRDMRTGTPVLGRFGWKANIGSVDDQVSAAFRGDVGITSARASEQPCTDEQPVCGNATPGGSPEVDEDLIATVGFYVKALAVPGRRPIDDDVRQGARVFDDAGCAGCHTPQQRTTDAGPALPAQTISPFTDLLVHDMGPLLADGRADSDATGSEWRTAPLWGIGNIEPINGHTRFLHDGRARDLSEAILWHGGEAQDSREYYRLAPADQRDALIAFLESL